MVNPIIICTRIKTKKGQQKVMEITRTHSVDAFVPCLILCTLTSSLIFAAVVRARPITELFHLQHHWFNGRGCFSLLLALQKNSGIQAINYILYLWCVSPSSPDRHQCDRLRQLSRHCPHQPPTATASSHRSAFLIVGCLQEDFSA